MLPSLSERAQLAKRFAPDVRRMRRCLDVLGAEDISDDMIVWAWSAYSAEICAKWLSLPKSNDGLLNVLRNRLPQLANLRAVAWECAVLSAGDGTDDVIVELPVDLMARLGWEIGDQVILEGDGVSGWTVRLQ